MENEPYVPKGRNTSLSCGWDATSGDASDSDSESDPSNDQATTLGLMKNLESFGTSIFTTISQAANASMHNMHPNSGQQENLDQTESIASRLVNANPSFMSVNEKVDEHLSRLMEETPKKSGVSLLEDDKSQLEAYQMLSQVPPFSYLPNAELKRLVMDVTKVQYSDGEVIVGQNDTDDDVYVLAEGRVVMVRLEDASTNSNRNSKNSNNRNNNTVIGKSHAKYIGYLDAPAYFGEFGTLFDAARNAQVIAGANSTCVYRMAGDRFQDLCHDFSSFRLKLALGLRQHGIFRQIDSFIAIVQRAVSHDSVYDFAAILESYRKMAPAIHANLHSSELDIDGWTYAVRRLPDTITSTYVYLLASHIPMPFEHSNFDLKAVQVKTAARRRQAFALDDHGKLLVIMRENYSDVLDFLSLLCAHAHESEKLRNKLVRPSALHTIHSCLWSSSLEESSSATTGKTGPTRPCRRTYNTATLEEQKAALQKLPLTDTEKKGLQSLWPSNFLYRIWDIISLHENIQIRSDLASAYVESTDRWAESIRRAVKALLCPCQGEGDVCLTTGITSHIISSNTTSVRNLLSPYILKSKQTIQDWGKEEHPDLMSHESLSESDKLCALCNAYMKSHPEARKEQDDFDKTCFKTLRRTEMTGIQVELIDLNALEATYAKHDIAPDPFLSTCFPHYSKENGWSLEDENYDGEKRKGRLLVNIDYAFGKQAEQLISALSLLLDQSLSSVGVMGKAGGLQGKRGDIIVADYLVHQEGDEQTLIDNTGVDRDALHSLSGRAVHSGGVLTVLGTLLQDSRLLNFYKKLYGCVSLEMEGSFYARELRRYKKAGLLSSDVNLRFLYYISDTPLSTGEEQSETLSQDMSIAEVIPPQYAVTRALLHPVLSDR